jgi:hypothetical protein
MVPLSSFLVLSVGYQVDPRIQSERFIVSWLLTLHVVALPSIESFSTFGLIGSGFFLVSASF